MPLADRDIIITPNRGASSEPSIAFRGADTATSATVTLKVYNSSTVGTVSFEGAVGQLMTIVDSMAGTIFSANDISGVPSIEVLDTGEVKLAPFNGFVTIAGLTTITNTTAASSTLTGALQVRGGVGIGDDLYVGDSINALGQIISTRANNATTGAAQIYLNGSAGNRIDFNGNGVAAPAFTTRSAGTKIVLYPEISGSSVDYALGVEGSTLWFSVPVAARYFKWYAGTTNIATLEGNGNFTLTQTTNATSTITGVLQVRGGAGIGGNLYVGGTINGNLTGNVTGTATTATFLSAGSASQVIYKNASNVVTGSSGLTYDGVSLKVNGNLESTFSNGDEGGEIFLNKPVTNTTINTGVTIDVYQNKLRFFENGGTARGFYIDITTGAAGGNTNLVGGGAPFNGGTITSPLIINDSTAATSTTTGALQIVNGGAGIGGTVVADQFHSINNANGTNFKVGDDAWIGDINIADTLRITGQQNAANAYIVFGNSNSTNYIGRAGTNPITVTGAFNVTGVTKVTDTTTASSTITGSLQVSGGVGIGGDVYTGGLVVPRVNNNGATTSGTITPTAGNSDQFELIGLTGAITIAAPTGIVRAGQKLTLRIKDNGTSRGITWTTSAGGFRIIGTTLPTATTANKNTYIGCIYNATDGYWDVVAVATEA